MKKWQVAFGFLAISLLIGTGFLLKPIFEGMAKAEGDRENSIPTLRLYLDGVNLDGIKAGDKETKYEGNRLVVDEKNDDLEFDDVQIKGRGNSTWGLPKSPFQIKFKQKVDLFGLGKRKKYVLLANYIDRSFMRNDIMFKLVEMVDSRYRSQGEFVELYVDDDYQGLYYLTTKIELGKSGIDIRDNYAGIFELDTLHEYSEDCYYTNARECLLLEDAVFADDEVMAKEIMNDFVEQFNLLEKVAKKRDYEEILKVIDVESFAEYFLISEFAVNPDAYSSSFKFYKKGLDDKIYAGPLWDFDYAFSNFSWIWSNNDDFYSPEIFMAQRGDVFANDYSSGAGRLMYYLMEISEFEEEVARIWREELSGRKDELLIHISNRVEYIREAALRDEAKWREETLFEEEVEYLSDWVSRRYDFFEQRYGKEGAGTVL